MMERLRQTIWHRWLRRPFRLNCAVDVGEGQPVVLLHGLGRDASVWQFLVKRLQDKPFRVIGFDLLGFGQSPKPDWLRYDVDDHVQALAAGIRRLGLRTPVVLVGHSMGSLVAVRLARLYPELVRHAILYEMPLYSGLPDKRRYRLRLNVYFKLYKQVIGYQPHFNGAPTVKDGRGRLYRAGQAIGERMLGTKLTPETWRSFIRSLEHVIIEQETAADIKKVSVPIEVIYGSRDRLVIRGKTQALFGEDVTHISGHTIRESHRISAKASAFIAGRLEALG